MAEETNATNKGTQSASSSGDIFAQYGPNTPAWLKVYRQTAEGGFGLELVQDNKLISDLNKAVVEKYSHIDDADADDSPDQNMLLMTAWQALASYLSSCDNEDKQGATIALKVVSNLISGNDPTGPMPTGTFGATTQAAASEYTCPKCNRYFATEAGLISHLASIHSAREKVAGPPKTETD